MPGSILYNGQLIDIDSSLIALDRADCEDSLYTFLKHAWRYIDPTEFVPGWPLEAMCEHLEAVVDGEIKRLCINIPPRAGKSSVVSVAFPAWVWAQRFNGPTSGPGVPLLHASYALALAMRDSVKTRRLIESPWYQKHWGDRFQLVGDQNTKGRFANTKKGERLITAVDAKVTGEGAQIIVIDDANAANESLSEAVVETTREWWDGTMSTRLNDQKTGAFIVIQQRLSEEDLTGHILEKDKDGEWCHLMLPMEYEPERSFSTLIGWKDPRTEAGELLWPERFGVREVRKLREALGPWKCNPYEAPILMADLSMKPVGEIKVGDEIIGFEKNKTKSGRKFGRQSLTNSIVTEIHQHRAEIVKMTLESGEVIRCTRDHKWFMKDRGPNREMYMPVTMRKGTSSKLARVCPAHLPTLTLEDERDAGWLAGFFDGEGSVSLQKRKGEEFRPGGIISFYQGAGRNLPLCQKLERLLTRFGFEYSYTEDERKTKKDAACYGYRAYRLKHFGLPMLQKFLHIIQPVKWRNRIISSALKANFIQQRERVLSIEPDGEETVYGLTTTTGNYVVWGLASSNSSGQLQQRPEPAGGGVIKRDWWQLWEADAYPPMDYVLASLDTAYTTKTENDFSALSVWGVFSGDVVAQSQKSGTGGGVKRSYATTTPQVMLMYAWQERLEIHELVKKVASTCKAMKVDKLIIENKAAGHSVAQELRRLYDYENFSVQLYDPKGADKLARLYSVQHLFSGDETIDPTTKQPVATGRMIWAPNKQWAETLIAQVGTFPKGKHDDLVDTCSMSLRHLRDLGMLQRGPESMAETEAEMQFKGRPPPPLYAV